MSKFLQKIQYSFVIFISVFALIATPVGAKADPAREFILSCSYGVLAGTLVGAATLAFSDKPGDNLNKVARGASIGLYAGILLGAYVVYGVPSDEDETVAKEFEAIPLNEALKVKHAPPVVRAKPASGFQSMALIPLIGQHGLEGGAVSARVLAF
jgi:hypothetical protein